MSAISLKIEINILFLSKNFQFEHLSELKTSSKTPRKSPKTHYIINYIIVFINYNLGKKEVVCMAELN